LHYVSNYIVNIVFITILLPFDIQTCKYCILFCIL